MKILYYDCFSGISGDMNLGAMVDLGVDKEYLLKELSKLHLEGYQLRISSDNRKGISGTKVEVLLEKGESADHSHGEAEEGHHHKEHSHGEHHHRNLHDIEHIIKDSKLSDTVKQISLDIFMKVAEAEAKVHGTSIYEVHFHEVGAIDSIVDIVGAAICIEYLKVDCIAASSVEVGGGFVRCAHGIIPVPAPATVEILKGIPIKSGAVPFETATPTGAAILATLVNKFIDKKEFKINKIGYGIGQRDTEIPNVLRVFIGEIEKNSIYVEKCASDDGKNSFIELCGGTVEQDYMVECNIDDMNPELYDYVMERLFKEGAMDVYLTSIIMKKGRPGIKISVLCSGDIEDKVKEILLKETSTLGVRSFKVEKTMLKREQFKIDTVYGTIGVKNSYYNGKRIKSKPEYDDCKKAAIDKKVEIRKVYDEVSRNVMSVDTNIESKN